MHKTSVYTLFNGNIKELAHRKQQNHKRWYYSAAHWHTVSVWCGQYHLLWFCCFRCASSLILPLKSV